MSSKYLDNWNEIADSIEKWNGLSITANSLATATIIDDGFISGSYKSLSGSYKSLSTALQADRSHIDLVTEKLPPKTLASELSILKLTNAPTMAEHASTAKSSRENIIITERLPHDFVVNEIDSYLAKEVKKLYDEQNYNHAAHDAIQHFVEKVQKKAKIYDESRYGVDLMSNVFGENGVLRTQKRVITPTDKDFNEGIKFTAMGLMKRHRNPLIHKSTSRHPYTRLECLNVLTTVNMLLRDLEKCKYYAKK